MARPRTPQNRAQQRKHRMTQDDKTLSHTASPRQDSLAGEGHSHPHSPSSAWPGQQQASLPPLMPAPGMTGLQLWLGMVNLLSLPSVLPRAKDGSLPWNASLREAANALRHQLGHHDTATLAAHAGHEWLKETEAFLKGVLAFQQSGFDRSTVFTTYAEHNWHKGAARLCDFRSMTRHHDKKGPRPTMLMVPSLINRPYILDLLPGHSMARYLAEQGVDVLVLDWGVPGESEKQLDIAGYVQERLLPALMHARTITDGPLYLCGYCMGGVLSLAAAQLADDLDIDGLALLATPWDFHANALMHVQLDADTCALLESVIEQEGCMPSAMLQPMFYRHDPWLYQRKFARFYEMEEGDPEREFFIALEYWAQDGVPLTPGVARDCLFHWAHDNATARGEWLVDGQVIDLQHVRCPSFVAVAQNDRIVPPACSAALSEKLQRVTHIEPDAGHVGMIVGSKAEKVLWRPLVDWLFEQRK